MPVSALLYWLCKRQTIVQCSAFLLSKLGVEENQDAFTLSDAFESPRLIRGGRAGREERRAPRDVTIHDSMNRESG